MESGGDERHGRVREKDDERGEKSASQAPPGSGIYIIRLLVSATSIVCDYSNYLNPFEQCLASCFAYIYPIWRPSEVSSTRSAQEIDSQWQLWHYSNRCSGAHFGDLIPISKRREENSLSPKVYFMLRSFRILHTFLKPLTLPQRFLL